LAFGKAQTRATIGGDGEHRNPECKGSDPFNEVIFMPDLSWREAISQVRGVASEPMHYTEIAEAIAEQGLKTEVGTKPALISFG